MTTVNLLFYGQPRFSDHVWVSESIKREILDRYNNYRVFAHMWYSLNTNYDVSSWVDKRPVVSPAAPMNFMARYDRNFESLSVEKPRFFSPNNFPDLEKRFSNNEYFSETNVSNVLSQLYSIKTVARNALENPSVTEKDWFVLTRYDGVITKFPDLNKLSPMDRKLYIPKRGSDFNDLIWVFGHSVLERLVNLNTTEVDIDKLNNPIPEDFKKAWYAEHCQFDHSIIKLDMYSEVVRSF